MGPFFFPPQKEGGKNEVFERERRIKIRDEGEEKARHPSLGSLGGEKLAPVGSHGKGRAAPGGAH